MSIRIMTRVWDHATQNGSALLALLALADYANEDGLAWPAIEHIAQRCRLSERQTQRLLTELESEAAIYIQRRQGRAKKSRYVVLVGMTETQIEAVLRADPLSLSEADIKKVTSRVTQKRKGDIEGSKRDEKMTSGDGKGDIQGKNDGRLPPVGAPSGDPIRHIDPSIKNDPSDSMPPADAAAGTSQPLPEIPRGHHAYWGLDDTMHIRRDGANVALCGEGSGGQRESPPAQPVPCAACAKKAKKARAPWADLTDAMHAATPEEIRPTRVNYAKHDLAAKAVWDAGYSAEGVAAYVRWAYEHDPYITGQRDGHIKPIWMGHVAENINAVYARVKRGG